ncbi:MAG: hypothetical protein QOC92_97 [Acidimicrobiaceae bacterium]|jgi:hypothetical protein
MNGIAASLLDLVGVGESPLYSAYRWLGREIGRDLSRSEFLSLVDRLVEEDVLRLWSVDPDSEDRTRLMSTPDGLEHRYRSLGHTDGSYDPFGLSLTAGPEAEVRTVPDWQVDFDFDSQTFELEVRAGLDDEALARLRRLFPDVKLVEAERVSTGDHTRVSGQLVGTDRGEVPEA